MVTKRKYYLKKRRRALGMRFIGPQALFLGKKTNRRERFILPNGKSIVEMKNNVLKMQSELARVVREGNTPLIKPQIEKMLRNSDCRYYAVYRTISSSGAKSKGIKDIFRPTKVEHYYSLYQQLWEYVKHPEKYRSTPLKRIWLPKPNSTELRPISVPSYIDRAIQHLYLLIVEVFHEEIAENNSYGFRPFRSPGWAAKAVTLFIWSRKGFQPPKYAIELDIRKCFDSISHDFLRNHVGKTRISGEEISIIHPNILNQWLNSGYVDVKGTLTPKSQLVPTNVGIPQGGPISPTLSNMVLNGIEEVVTSLGDNNISKDRSIKLSPDDKIIWKMNGTPILCTFGLDAFNYIQAYEDLQQAGFNISKAAVFSLLSGLARNKKKEWSLEYINPNNSMFKFLNNINNQKTALFRFADDCIIFANSEEMVTKILAKIDIFLKPRGLEVNFNKTKIRNLRNNETFNFVGFEFSITLKHGRWKVYNFPPAAKVKNLKSKVKQAIQKCKTSPYTCFYMVNAIVRGWCNFYSTGNSKGAFNVLRKWLFDTMYKYLFKFYSFRSQYKKKSSLYKKRISAAIFRDNLLPTLYNPSVKWLAIPNDYIPIKKRGFDGRPYFLINPGAIEVSTPSIITGKSCFYPSDRQELQGKAIYWQKGLLKRLLIKSKGFCQNCGCTLVDLQETVEIHHIQPKMFKGQLKFTNLAVLCKECHTLVTNAVKARDLQEIAIYENNNNLKNVSNLLAGISDLDSN